MEKEIWKDVPGFEKYYQVSNLGNVKSLSRKQSTHERILKQETTKQKYKRVVLSVNNKTKRYSVHRLVAEAFIINLLNKPQINHIDGNKQNNKVSNLEWCNASENMKHAFKTGLQTLTGENNTMAKLTEKDVRSILIMLESGMKHKDIAYKYSVSRRCITDINVGNTWAHITNK